MGALTSVLGPCHVTRQNAVMKWVIGSGV